MSEPVSFKFRWQRLGGRVHVRIYTSEFGPHTTHGQNTSAPIVFREIEWEEFRRTFEIGADRTGIPSTAVQFIEGAA